MWLCNIPGLLLLICLSQVSTLARSDVNDDDQDYFQRELIKMLERKLDRFSANDDGDSREMEGEEYYVDPADRVDVALWNQRNAEDIKNMPVTKDYSSEIDAMKWLRWYSRVSDRYRQVRLQSELVLFFILRLLSGWRTSQLEP